MSIISKNWNAIQLKRVPICIFHEYNYSSKITTFSDLQVNEIKDTRLSALKRGTGGRSSFNGITCTVFGATGFVGPKLINRLGKIGTQLIVPYRSDLAYAIPIRTSSDLGQMYFHHFHLRDEDSIRKAVVHSDVVINLIGCEFPTSNFGFYDVNVTGCQTIARISREMGVKKLIHFSSLNVAEYPEPVVFKQGSEFLRTKWIGEQRVREEFPEAVIFRPADMWGEDDRFLRYYGNYFRMFGKTMLLWKKGKGVVKQPVDVTDVVGAVVEAVKDPDNVGKIYQCVGPKRYNLDEFVNWYAYYLRRSEEWGYSLADARFNPFFWAYLLFCDKTYFRRPNISVITFERFEREHITDRLESGAYTLEDIGIQLTRLEDVIKELTFWMSVIAYYEEDPHEVPDPPELQPAA